MSNANLPQVLLIGGFLGAGKTTLVAEIARRLMDRSIRVGIVTNDQASDLVDTALLKYQGINADEVAGGCFCCRFDDFIARLRELRLRQADVLIGEPVGSCTDLAATVVRPLQRIYTDLFRTAPYTVLVDPFRWRGASAPAKSPLAERALYIYRLQIAEADTIVLSKCDLLTPEKQEAIVAEIEKAYPGRPIYPVSALNGAGVDALLDHILSGTSSGTHRISVDYDRYAEGEAELGWLNASVEFASLTEQDWAGFCRRLLMGIRDGMAKRSYEIAHAKILLAAGEHFIAGNLTGITGIAADPLVRGGIPRLTSELSMTLNIRAVAPPEEIEAIVSTVLVQAAGTSSRYTVTRHAAFRPGRPVPTHKE